MKRQHIFILVIAALCSGIAQGDIPKSGNFDIDGSSAVSFDLVPCVSPPTVHLWPFASSDEYSTSPYSKYNLAQVSFSGGSFMVTDSGEKYGDLGIRIGNYTGAVQIFEDCILTLDFIGGGNFDIYLPEFTFGSNENMFFWVAESGSTYYARSSKGAGFPDMSATEAMSAGDEYLVRVFPEPATVLLLGLGSLVLLRRRSV